MDFALDEKTVEMRERLLAFMEEFVYPAEGTFREQADSAANRWDTPPVIGELKAEARTQGLWNLFLPATHPHGAGLTNLQYAPLAEITGRSPWIAPEALNCSAPDTGNMELLSLFGTQEQQERWLHPLLDGTIRSAFSMTEPAVASSDATNIATRISRDGDHYVINGRKWWSSGAMSPRCALLIVMGVTDPDAEPYRRQSMICVPPHPRRHGAALDRRVRLRRRPAWRPCGHQVRQRARPGREPARRGGRRLPHRPGAPRSRTHPSHDARHRDGRTGPGDDVPAHRVPHRVRAADHRAGRGAAVDLPGADMDRAGAPAGAQDGVADGHGRAIAGPGSRFPRSRSPPRRWPPG